MIELHPEDAGSPIIGGWKEASALYLVGSNGGFRFSHHIRSGDMPIAVICRGGRDMTIAPVHPMCHVGSKGQAVTSVTSGETIQLGSGRFRLSISKSARAKKWDKKRLLVAVLVVSALAGGWLLHDLFSVSSNAVAATDAYIF